VGNQEVDNCSRGLRMHEVPKHLEAEARQDCPMEASAR
jgi:hypothetical protein